MNFLNSIVIFSNCITKSTIFKKRKYIYNLYIIYRSRRTKLSFRGTINKSSQVEENSSNEIKTNEKKGNDFFANLFKKK